MPSTRTVTKITRIISIDFPTWDMHHVTYLIWFYSRIPHNAWARNAYISSCMGKLRSRARAHQFMQNTSPCIMHRDFRRYAMSYFPFSATQTVNFTYLPSSVTILKYPKPSPSSLPATMPTELKRKPWERLAPYTKAPRKSTKGLPKSLAVQRLLMSWSYRSRCGECRVIYGN